MDHKVAAPDRSTPTDASIAELAVRQHGVVSIWQLRDLGVGDGAVRKRIRAGRLHRLHRGVFAVGHRAVAMEGRCLAAVLAIGAGRAGGAGPVLDYWGGAVSHRSAAGLWGLLPVEDGQVDVAVENGAGKASRRGIRLHRPRSLVPSDVTLCRGIPVTTPARTISDLTAALAAGRPTGMSGRELRRAVRQADVLGLRLDGPEGNDRTRSDLEADFVKICMRHGLPAPEVNVKVGGLLVDFLWRDHGFVVETDGYQYHRGRAAFREDHARDLRLWRLGYDVKRFSEVQISEEADEVAEALASRLIRPTGD